MSARRFRLLANACVVMVLLGAGAMVVYLRSGGEPDSPIASNNVPAVDPKSQPGVDDARPKAKALVAAFQRRVNNPANMVEVRADGATVMLDPAARRELLDRLNAAFERATVEAVPASAPASQPRPAAIVEVFYRESLGRLARATLRMWDSPGRVELRIIDDAELRGYRCVGESTQFVLWLANAPKRK